MGEEMERGESTLSTPLLPPPLPTRPKGDAGAEACGGNAAAAAMPAAHAVDGLLLLLDLAEEEKGRRNESEAGVSHRETDRDVDADADADAAAAAAAAAVLKEEE